MIRHVVTALRFTAITALLFGIAYPIAMTGLAQTVFPAQANGSIVRFHGRVVGSDIVGQLWLQPQYFHGRPSAAGKRGYDPTATGGTNLGPTSKKLIATTKTALAQLRGQNPGAAGPPPIDLVTSSGSGIDPDISPEAAYYQAPRIAATRHMSLRAVKRLIAQRVRGRAFGFLGEPRVNVLSLNTALEASRRLRVLGRPRDGVPK
ncbi:MAG TPA: potassium-transporting ATPase subunit KdpC [Candidatus Baltobacteraceae bacterium]|jgi:K+-transporting ATPase ATPase C chain